MKQIKYLLIGTFLFICSIINVNAFTDGQAFTVSHIDYYSNNLVMPHKYDMNTNFSWISPVTKVYGKYNTVFTGNFSNNTSLQMIDRYKSSGYDVFCLDPGLSDYKGVMHADLYLTAGTSNIDISYEAGMVAIFNTENIYNLDDNFFYAARQFALRAYDGGFWNRTKDYTGKWAENDYYYAAFINYAKYWVDNIYSTENSTSEISNAIKELGTTNLTASYNKVKSYATDFFYIQTSFKTYHTHGSTNSLLGEWSSYEEVLATAREMYYNAILASAVNKDGLVEEAKLELYPTTQSSVTYEDGLKTQTRTYTIKASDFSKGTLTNFSLDFPSNNPDMDVLVTSYKVNNKTVSTLSNLDLSDNPTIEVTLKINALKTDGCNDANINFNYTFTTENELSGSVGRLESPGMQRMVIYEPGSTTTQSHSGTINGGKINLCPVDCSIKMDVDNECDIDGDSTQDMGSIYETSNIMSCVVDGVDEANNSYTTGDCAIDNESISIATNSDALKDNEYCSISCKEDYTAFRFPGVQDTKPGRYFKIGAEIEGTKTCYTNEIDVEAYNAKVNNIISTASSITTARNLIAAETDKLNACSAWDLDFEASPVINYTYESNYYDLAKSGGEEYTKMSLVSEIEDSNSVFRCNGTVNEKYSTCTGSTVNSTTNKTVYYKGTAITSVISNIDYYSVSKSKTMTYDSPESFYNVYPSGEIVLGKYEDATNTFTPPTSIETTLVDGLPITFDLEDGLYDFTFEIDDLGEYYSTCDLGRIVDVGTNKTDKSLDDNIQTSSTRSSYDGKYICYYDVPCPDCEFIPGTLPEPPCPECIAHVGDLYFRTYSTNNFNPNDRDLGYNWSYDYKYDINSKYGFVIEKSKLTIEGDSSHEGVIGLADEVYAQEALLTVDLTPQLSSEIKAYNNDNNYLDNSLTCYGEGSYDNIYCYSNFLDEMASDHPNEFNFIDNRPLSVLDRENNEGDYFITYTLNIPPIGPTSVGGPSWK